MLIESIEKARHALEFDVWAWVFMPDHVHLIVYPRRRTYNIADIRKQIKEPMSKQALRWLRENAPEWLPNIERKRGVRTEHLNWQSGGGYDRNITQEETLMNMIDYIHENPVRKNLVTRGRDWKWSSAAWYADQTPTPLTPDQIPFDWLEETGGS